MHKPGSSPVVSATGYTLGGGVGFFARKYGMSSDHVIEFEVVDAEGERRAASAEENPDLFHALAGGGGDYAIVTAMTVRLHEEPELFGGTVMWPAARAAEVFAAFREVTAAAPEELTSGSRGRSSRAARRRWWRCRWRIWVRRTTGARAEAVRGHRRRADGGVEGAAVHRDRDHHQRPGRPGPSVSRAELLGRLRRRRGRGAAGRADRPAAGGPGAAPRRRADRRPARPAWAGDRGVPALHGGPGLHAGGRRRGGGEAGGADRLPSATR